MKLISIEEIWNQALAQKRREPKRREYLWAGDIGKNFYERYLKMSGEPVDTPLDERVLRKFSAGLWFEDQIGYVFKTMGIMTASQEPIEVPEDDKHLKVTGRLDYVVGGVTDWNEARQRVKDAKFPEFVETISLALIDNFEEKYADGLEEAIVEVKSVNSQVFWSKKDYLAEAYPHHVMQLFTYLKAKNIPKGIILYISKDDLTIKEMVILRDDPELEVKWQADVLQMTQYWRDQKEPPKPDDIVFDPRKKLTFQHLKQKHVIQGCWVANWEVAWSSYFEKITGCKEEDEWLSRINPLIAEKNLMLKDKFKENLIK